MICLEVHLDDHPSSSHEEGSLHPAAKKKKAKRKPSRSASIQAVTEMTDGSRVKHLHAEEEVVFLVQHQHLRGQQKSLEKITVLQEFGVGHKVERNSRVPEKKSKMLK
ncbi:hypothetical protein VIGAN_05228000 [Vigna angularis var. angularis]|uniref:Uncharacterized protein n=1 Tax=Vigna angularis var. angularis TaxID=157739 RepID=A0A0S3S777_PHAAN|nr:hypothetical protein VIGAN_05228000 [Vigna angularis var. angularis]